MEYTVNFKNAKDLDFLLQNMLYYTEKQYDINGNITTYDLGTCAVKELRGEHVYYQTNVQQANLLLKERFGLYIVAQPYDKNSWMYSVLEITDKNVINIYDSYKLFTDYTELMNDGISFICENIISDLAVEQ